MNHQFGDGLVLGVAFVLCAGTSDAFAQLAPETPVVERLFFTAQQRADMDRRRIANIPDTPTAEGNSVTLNGYVRRSNGQNTTWVNGQALTGSAAPQVQGNRVIISTGADGASQKLKVGQSLDRQNGRIQDMLEPEQLQVGPAKPVAKQPGLSAPAAQSASPSASPSGQK